MISYGLFSHFEAVEPPRPASPHTLCKQKYHSFRDISPRNMHTKIQFNTRGKVDNERKRLAEKKLIFVTVHRSSSGLNLNTLNTQ